VAQNDGNLLPVGDQGLPNMTRWTLTGGTATFLPGTSRIVPASFKATAQVAQISANTTSYGVKLNNAVSVTAGQEFVAWGWFLLSATRSITATVTIHWLDAGGVELSTTTRGRTESFTGSVPYRASAYGVAPVGATQAKQSLMFSGVSGDITLVDFLYLGHPAPGDLLTFPEFTSDYSLAPWESDTGTVALERLLSNNLDGDAAATFVPTGTGVHSVTLNRWIPVTPGETYGLRATLVMDVTDPNQSISTRMCLEVRNGDGEAALITPGPFYTVNGEVGFYGSVITDRTFTVPADTVDARVVVQLNQEVANTTTKYYVDAVSMAVSDPNYVLTVDDAAGMVSIEVYDEPAAPGGVTVSVYRMEEDGSQIPVRGYGHEMVNQPYSYGDPIFLEDYEAPVGTRIYYRVEWRDVSGVSMSQLDTDSVQAPNIEDGSYVWVKSPGNPALNTMALMAENPSWSMSARSAMYQVIGRPAPVQVSEVRSSRTGTLAIRIADWDTNDAARTLLSSGLPLLVQSQPGHGMDGNLYFAIGDVAYAPDNWNATVPGWLWTLDVTEIDRPVGGIQGSAGRTWQDVLDGFESWDEVLATYDTWLDVQTGG
jgi:hypothetical protein